MSLIKEKEIYFELAGNSSHPSSSNRGSIKWNLTQTIPTVPLKERRKRTQRERGWFWSIKARALFKSRWFYRPQFLLSYFILMKLTTYIILQLCLPRMSRKGNKPILLAQRSRVSSRSLEDFLWSPVLLSARDKPRGQDSRDSCLVPSRSPSLFGEYLRYWLPLQGFRQESEIQRRHSSSSRI